ncbi:MAG: serine/threonine-protein phosphatase [Bacteroidales bacterium]|nr:serine/threonine-protein phosphatase [Bacteroidales bacterium]
MELKQLQVTPYSLGFAESRVGGRAENQDSYASAETPLGFLVTVCDGMGGGPGGRTASTIAVTEIVNAMFEASAEHTAINNLKQAIRRANMAIYTRGQEDSSLMGMGSTCTALLINNRSAIVAHVGDSRVYQLRGKSKIFRTFDHSMVFDLVRQKVITEEQARLSAQSNVITRALGIKPDVEVEVIELPYEKGDRFLLCTDGIHGTMPEKRLIASAARRGVSLGVVVDDIATMVDNQGRTNGGGHDNLTLAIIETTTNSKLKSKMTKRAKTIIAILAVLFLASLALNIVLLSSKCESARTEQPAVGVSATDAQSNVTSDQSTNK